MAGESTDHLPNGWASTQSTQRGFERVFECPSHLARCFSKNWNPAEACNIQVLGVRVTLVCCVFFAYNEAPAKLQRIPLFLLFSISLLHLGIVTKSALVEPTPFQKYDRQIGSHFPRDSSLVDDYLRGSKTMGTYNLKIFRGKNPSS